MNILVFNELNDIANRNFYSEGLNELVKKFIHEKVYEQSVWSELTLNSHFMFGGNCDKVYKAAAIVELIVLALDIMDDLQDMDNFEKPWMKCKREDALNVLVGLLLSAINEITHLVDSNVRTVDIITFINNSIIQAINGQHKDLNDLVHNEEQYIDMIEEKSSGLVQIACLMGILLINEVDPELHVKMMTISKGIGIVYQIENDISGLISFNSKNDLLKKKKTLPILFLLQMCESTIPILKQFYDGVISKEEFFIHKHTLIDSFINSGAIEYSKAVQSLYLHKAEELFRTLKTIPPWNRNFKTVAFSVYRN